MKQFLKDFVHLAYNKSGKIGLCSGMRGITTVYKENSVLEKIWPIVQ